MAVYERIYKRYLGELTPRWTRFLILPRYTLRDVFSSKLLLGFFVICFLGPFLFAAGIYVRHNVAFLEVFSGLPLDQWVIDGKFFRWFMGFQAFLAFVLALFVGPGLVSRDLANNGLALYLSRPMSRWEYVLGKLSVLALLLSPMTWLSGWLLYALQSNLAGDGWFAENLEIVVGMFVGSWVWILTISLLALALSAWVKWRAVATFLMLMIFIGGAFFAALIDALFGVPWMNMVNLSLSMNTLWDHLLGLPPESEIPLTAAWLAILGTSALSLFLLNRKIRAYEVVG